LITSVLVKSTKNSNKHRVPTHYTQSGNVWKKFRHFPLWKSQENIVLVCWFGMEKENNFPDLIF